MLDDVRDLSEALRRRVLKILYHVAIGIEAKHKSVALDIGLEKRRQSPNDFSQERMRHQRVERSIAAINQCQPELVAPIRRNAIGKTRKIVDEDVRVGSPRSTNPYSAHAITSGFTNEDKRLIGTHGDTVWEIEISENNMRLFCARVESQEPPIRLMLEDVGLEFSQRKLVRRVSKIDRAILGNVQIVRTTKRHAVSLCGQRGHPSIAID